MLVACGPRLFAADPGRQFPPVTRWPWEDQIQRPGSSWKLVRRYPEDDGTAPASSPVRTLFPGLPALLICLIGGGACSTRPNPAFRVEERPAASDRADARPREIPQPPDAAAPAPDAEIDVGSAIDVPPDLPEEVALDPDAGSDASDEAPPAEVAPDLSPDSPLSIGLVVRYPLDVVTTAEVPDDSRRRPGAMFGAAGWSVMGFPQAQFANGGALTLDGSSGYVVLPVAGLPAMTATKSVSLWFWQPAPIGDIRRTVVTLANPSESVGFHIGLQGGVPSVWVWRQLVGTALVAASQPSPAGWTHLVLVHQGNILRLYVNGALAGNGIYLGRAAAVTTFMLGAYAVNEGVDERWNGRIDDVRLYDRALTATEVSALAAGAL
jgi:hypothetical protein